MEKLKAIEIELGKRRLSNKNRDGEMGKLPRQVGTRTGAGETGS